jgi:uncharacterized protein DUF1931
MPVMAVAKFERFFREAAGLDIDKADLKRYSDFIGQKLYDLLLMAEATAKANRRHVIQPSDLPITKGLQERIHEFEKLEESVELQPILEVLAARPPLELSYSDETEARLPSVVGGLSVALARSFEIVDPNVRNPQTVQWERVLPLFDLLL